VKAREILADALQADGDNTGIVNLLDTSPDLRRLVAVWTNVPIPLDPDPNEECPASLPVAIRLRWVWSRLDPDPVPVWITYAGLPDAPHIRRLVQMAMDNRIVFPDGTLSQWATVYLQREARSVLGVREQRPAPVASARPADPGPPSTLPPPDTPPPLPDGMLRPRRRLRSPGNGE
jgi:hypothetical protein